MTERIDIQITDKIDPNIARKLDGIGRSARRANTAVEELQLSLGGSSRGLRKFGTEMYRVETATSSLRREQKRTSSSTSTLVKRLIALDVARRVARNTLRLADSYTILENKLKNTVDTADELVDVMDDVFSIANRTRTDVQATAQSFRRLDIAMSDLGASQKETLELTETINKALIVSGATTSEQTSSLLQLSQAFNKGKLDGDEFRTVMETMPEIAAAIAKELDVTKGELLELAPQGKITAQVLRDALGGAADEISAKFDKLAPTVGQSLTVLENSLTKYIGEVNKSIGATETLAEGIITLSENLEELERAAIAVGAGMLVAFGPKTVASIVATTAASKGLLLTLGKIAIVAVAVERSLKLLTVAQEAYNASLDNEVAEKQLALMKQRLELLKKTSKEEIERRNRERSAQANRDPNFDRDAWIAELKAERAANETAFKILEASREKYGKEVVDKRVKDVQEMLAAREGLKAAGFEDKEIDQIAPNPFEETGIVGKRQEEGINLFGGVGNDPYGPATEKMNTFFELYKKNLREMEDLTKSLTEKLRRVFCELNK